MLYEVTRPGSESVLPFRFVREERVAGFLEGTGTPALFEVTVVLSNGDTTPAVNGKVWLEKYRLDQLRRAALDNTAPDEDAPMYTCAEPPAWHDDAWQVAQVFEYLQTDPNCPLATYTVNRAFAMAISGIVRRYNHVDETTVCIYVGALIRSMRTG